jgi:hypothetical protein
MLLPAWLVFIVHLLFVRGVGRLHAPLRRMGFVIHGELPG